MYPFADLSNFVSPFTGFLIDQNTISLLSPRFDVSPAFAPEDTFFNSTSSLDSSIASSGNSQKARSTLESALGPIKSKRQPIEFCNVCQKNITDVGKKSQGPRRHILQHHFNRPIFFCSLCPATSNYDKAHIRTHMKTHKGIMGEVLEVDKKTFAEEERRWFKRCFGEGAESRSNFICKPQKKMKPEVTTDDAKINAASSPIPKIPILFSIDRILSGRTHYV